METKILAALERDKLRIKLVEWPAGMAHPDEPNELYTKNVCYSVDVMSDKMVSRVFPRLEQALVFFNSFRELI